VLIEPKRVSAALSSAQLRSPIGNRGKVVMRKRNLRLIVVGVALLGAAGLFFLAMMGMIPKSNNPVALMRTVGQVSGAVGGLSLAMIIIGLIGKKVPTG
jgi:hypothetical protein